MKQSLWENSEKRQDCRKIEAESSEIMMRICSDCGDFDRAKPGNTVKLACSCKPLRGKKRTRDCRMSGARPETNGGRPPAGPGVGTLSIPAEIAAKSRHLWHPPGCVPGQ